LAQPLHFPPLRWLGWISYGLYVLHPLLRPLIDRVIDTVCPATALYGERMLITFSTALVVSVSAASMSWFLLERPFLSLKRYFKDRPAASFATENPVLAAVVSPSRPFQNSEISLPKP